MKTTRQWLMTLPKGLRESIKTSNKYSINSSTKLEFLSMAIIWGFGWHDTKEGHEFWAAFYECLKWAEGGE